MIYRIFNVFFPLWRNQTSCFYFYVYWRYVSIFTYIDAILLNLEAPVSQQTKRKFVNLSVICVVFLWSVSIDKAYLNVLVVISKLLGQFILGMRHIARNHRWFCSWIFINQIASFMTSANKRWTIFGRRWWKLVPIFF